MMASVGQARRQLPRDALRIDRVRRLHRALLERLPPVVDMLSIRSRQRRDRLLLEQRQQRAQRLGRIALQVDLHRVADAQHAGVDVDLHAARLRRPSAGIRNRGKPCRSSAGCRTPSSGRSWAWCRAGRCEPVTHGRSSGSTALPSSALATPAPSRSATAMTSSRRAAAHRRRPGSRPSCPRSARRRRARRSAS